jgi:hypothetical protein
MVAFIFTLWLTYSLTTALWLGDYGWTPIVGIPWVVINLLYTGYVIKTDVEGRR